MGLNGLLAALRRLPDAHGIAPHAAPTQEAVETHQMGHYLRPLVLTRGEAVDPSEYYFRTAAFFETGAGDYLWLNKICAIGLGDRRATGPHYSMFEIL